MNQKLFFQIQIKSFPRSIDKSCRMLGKLYMPFKTFKCDNRNDCEAFETLQRLPKRWKLKILYVTLHHTRFRDDVNLVVPFEFSIANQAIKMNKPTEIKQFNYNGHLHTLVHTFFINTHTIEIIKCVKFRWKFFLSRSLVLRVCFCTIWKQSLSVLNAYVI